MKIPEMNITQALIINEYRRCGAARTIDSTAQWICMPADTVRAEIEEMVEMGWIEPVQFEPYCDPAHGIQDEDNAILNSGVAHYKPTKDGWIEKSYFVQFANSLT